MTTKGGPIRTTLVDKTLASARLAVRGVLAATRAELLQLDAVRVVAAVLPRDVVALFAVHARHGDLWTYVSRLGHSRAFLNELEINALQRRQVTC